jgi:hypothetical protein
MSWIRAEVLKCPATADTQVDPPTEMVHAAPTWMEPRSDPADYRSKAHAMLDALFDQDERVRGGHFFRIEMHL